MEFVHPAVGEGFQFMGRSPTNKSLNGLSLKRAALIFKTGGEESFGLCQINVSAPRPKYE